MSVPLLFGNRGRAWLRLELRPADEREALDSNLRLFDVFAEELMVADTACRRAASGRDDVRRLMTVTGIDFAVALARVAAIRDIERFPRLSDWSATVSTPEFFDHAASRQGAGSTSPKSAGRMRGA